MLWECIPLSQGNSPDGICPIGTISVEELGQVMRSLGLAPTAEDLHDIVAEIDVDNSGTIEFDGKGTWSRMQNVPLTFGRILRYHVRTQ